MQTTLPILICAYNEQRNIAELVKNLSQLNYRGKLPQIFVVDDGSTDNTAITAQQSGAKVLKLPKNLGKASAFFYGLKEFILTDNYPKFISLDADLDTVTQEQIQKLRNPIQDVNREISMTIGSVCGAISTLSGQRAYRTQALMPLINDSRYNSLLNQESQIRIGYGLEVLLNFVVCGFTEPIVYPRPPKEIEFVETNFQCITGFGTTQAHHKLKAPKEVEQTKKLCLAIRQDKK
jgi:glycosyltransferase involved in cell wall biosynthesis